MDMEKQRADGGSPEPSPARRRSWGIPRWVELVILLATAAGSFFGGQVVVVDRGGDDHKAEAVPTVTATATVTATPSSVTLAEDATPTDGQTGQGAGPQGGGRRTYLADVEQVGGDGAAAEPATMLGQSYPKAIRIDCNESGRSVVYNVSGYKTLQAQAGIASDSSNGIKSVGKVWVSNAAGNPIGKPVEIRSSVVRPLSADISGQDQIQISCVMTKSGSTSWDYFTMALGDAVLVS